MNRRPTPLPDDLGRRFSVAAAIAAGVGVGRLRGPDLESPFWGVRSTPFEQPAPDGIVDLGARRLRHAIEAYAERMPERRFFVGLSALVIWCGLLPVTKAPPVDVGVFAPDRTPRARGIRGHQLQPHLAHVVEHDGLRVISAASTWAGLARELAWADLVAVGSLLVTRPRGPGGSYVGAAPTTIASLQAAVDAGARKGVARLREALPFVREGARSRPEVHLFLAIVQAELPEPRYDVPVFDRTGALIGIFDLALEGHRVLIEFQGDYHRLSPAAWAADIRKRERAREEGWTVVEVVRGDLYPHAEPALMRIAAALARLAGSAG